MLRKLALLYIAIAIPAVAQSDGRAKEVCAQIQGIALDLTKISGMPLKHPVPCDFITKQKINKFLNDHPELKAHP